MPNQQILVVEDDEDILELVRYNLAREGYQVTLAESGEAGLKALQKHLPDLLILDLMLPEIDGLEVCKRIRASETMNQLPILMLTAKGEEADIVTGLELGADDYVTKPFSPRILLARVRAVLRRRSQPEIRDDDSIRIHDLAIHPGRHEVLVGGERVELTHTEFQVLHFLARRPGWVFTRYQIVDAVHGTDYAVTERSVDVQIVGLRKKLGEAGKLINTVRGVGYRFQEK
ncbi:MAG: response regulator transcription factor [Candidatus Hydrogenedentes bacterium]|nr:response regulator transcription factor [Candidatus Hydrogenedentota bacterium]